MTPLTRDALAVRGRFDRVTAPGTWDYLDPWPGGPRDLAAVTCPNGHLSRITGAVHVVDHEGLVFPSFVCRHDGCTFHDYVQLVGWDNEEIRVRLTPSPRY